MTIDIDPSKIKYGVDYKEPKEVVSESRWQAFLNRINNAHPGKVNQKPEKQGPVTNAAMSAEKYE